jgi:hypothetical protein
VVTVELAARELERCFGTLVDADYLTGKTRFRDALCDRLGLSELDAEVICDELEAARVLRFVESPTDGIGWSIEPLLADVG